MPNGRTHRNVGTAAGVAFAAYQARHQASPHAFIEAVGGALGGNLGARLPDIIDPPLSPRHRSIGHGLMPSAAAARSYLDALGALQAGLRTEADRRARLREQATDPLQALWQMLIECLCRLASGAIAGLPSGYVSHLVLDAGTPGGLPLLA